MKQKSIFQQLVIPMVGIVCALAVCLVFIIIIFFSSYYEKEVYHNNQDKSELIAGEIQTFLDGAYGITEELSVNPSILTMDTSVQTPILEDCVARNSYLELLYIQGTDGMQTGRSSGELADRSTRWWFIQTMEEQNAFISKSYYSVNTGMPCASIFFPMMRNNELVGIFAVDLKLDYLQSLTEQFSDEENGEYSFIIDGEGVVVAHPQSEQIEEQYNYQTLKKTVSCVDAAGNVQKDADGNIITEEQDFSLSAEYQQLISNVMQGGTGSEKISSEGSKYYVSYAPITLKGSSDSWSVITVYKASNAMAIVYRVIVLAAFISVIALIAAIAIITALAKKLTMPIVKITEIIADASEGDFSILADESSNNEIGTLSRSFNTMSTKISSIITKITLFSEKVIDSAGNVKRIRENGDLITQKVAEISEGSESQLSDAKQVMERATELEEKFRELGEKSEKMMKNAEETMESGKMGTQSIKELREHNMLTTERMNRSYDKIMSLNAQSLEIAKIVSTIDDISSETSLLALNASIEAARAGEQGKGFAVVAESIGKLASESSAATTHITDIIDTLCSDIKETVETIEGIKNEFQQQTGYVENVETVVDNFKNLADTTEQETFRINEMIDEMHKLERSMVHATQRILDISQNSVHLSEHVVEVLKQQNTDIDSVTGSIENLSQVSDEVDQELTKFKL